MKRIAALRGLEYIDEYKFIGIGTGTTVEFLIEELGKNRDRYANKIFYASSNKTRDLLLSYRLNVSEPDRILDIYIDGADSVDFNLNMIKGGGGALTREKILAYNSKFRVIIVDETKIKRNIFSFPMPVEILPFSLNLIKINLKEMNLVYKERISNDKLFITDNGNYILDVNLNDAENPFELAHKIKLIPGVIEIGLFENLADIVIIGKENLMVEEIKKSL
ncbi:MAG: ribose 5-phosphate isomerase A [Thermoplasmata archaeon]